MRDTSEVLTIAKVERASTGNFAFQVTFTSGREARTEVGSQVAYKIENDEYQGVPVEVTFNGDGRIVGIKVAGE